MWSVLGYVSWAGDPELINILVRVCRLLHCTGCPVPIGGVLILEYLYSGAKADLDFFLNDF